MTNKPRTEDNSILDITGADHVEIAIKSDGKVIWINTQDGCVVRICKIRGKVTIKDSRYDKQEIEESEGATKEGSYNRG